MLTLELPSIALEIPNDAYTTLSRNLIGCTILSQEYCKLIGWYWKIMGWQLSTLTCPFENGGFGTRKLDEGFMHKVQWEEWWWTGQYDISLDMGV